MAAVTQAAQEKFSTLRKRLDQLGYKQPLGIESLPLVERLFSDMVHTTESLKEAKLQAAGRSKEETPQAVEQYVQPYKSDNARLVKENNDLHLQLIKIKEETATKMKELKASLRKLEHESADLKFLNNQYIHKVQQLEEESRSKSERIQKLQEKNFHAVVQIPGGKRKNIAFRRQRMELDTPLPPVPIAPSSATDPYVANLLQVADRRIAQLQQETEVAQAAREAAERHIDSLREQVDARDAEIERLSRLLDGGKSFDVVSLEARNRANDRMIAHQNIQIEYLQNKTRELERRLSEAVTERGDEQEKALSASLKSRQLAQELSAADQEARQMRVEKDIVLESADREIEVAKSDLLRSRRRLCDTEMTNSQLRSEIDRLETLVEDRRLELVKVKADFARQDELVSKVQDDKRKLSGRVNRLVAHERELVLEISRLKNKNGVSKGKTKAPSRIEHLVKDIEAERDYFKNEVDTLNSLLKTRARSSSRPATPKARSRASSPVRSDTALSAKTSALEATVRVLEDEKAHWRREYERLRASRSRAASPVRAPLRTADSDAEVLRLTQERDDLKRLLDKFERHMAEIQANVKVLTSERDNLSTLYEETRTELQRARRDLVRSPKAPKTSLAAQAVLRRVENERDECIADLRRMTTERDSLRERLKIATESHISDRAQLEQRVEDLQSALRSADGERGELSARVLSLRETVTLMEDQVKSKDLEALQLKDTAANSESKAAQLQLLAEQTERTLDETQRTLGRRDVELRTASDEKRILQERVDDLTRTNQASRDDIAALRSTISAIDREKDSLQAQVDEKAERVATQDSQLYARDQTVGDLKTQVAELEIQLQRACDDVAGKERELASLRRQLSQVQEELAEVQRGRDAAVRDNRRLQDDLATMTRESQMLHGELNETRGELDALRQQAQDYISEVKRTEDILAEKEQERTDLLEQYRRMTAEHEMMTSHRHQLESEGSNLRIEVTTRDSEIRRLRGRNEDLEREIQEHVNSLRAYEVQVSQLSKSLASMESSYRTGEAERHGLLQDLQAVRDLCAKLDSAKESLTRQLTSRGLDVEQRENRIAELTTEVDFLKNQVNSESCAVKNLEEILTSNREKEFQSQLGLQERQAELQLTRDRLVLNEGKVETLQRELSQLRTRNVELDGEVDRLRRQLTTERFDKERAVSELRRQGLGSSLSSYRRSYSPSRSSSPSRVRSVLDDEDGIH